MESLSADCTGTVALGDVKTCTITNDDVAPTLALVKTVTTDNGGTAGPNDWNLTATGDGGFTEAMPEALAATVIAVKANIGYVLSEANGPSGYAPSGWTCIGGGALTDATITLRLNEDVTCTIDNDDIAPLLTVIKTVDNGDGGTAVAGEWTMDITGTKVSSTGFPGAESPGVTVTLDVGSYSVDESGGPTGYSQNLSADCTGTVAPGDVKTCTITNDDIAPLLTLVKMVTKDDGGTAEPDQWDLTATGDGGFTETTPNIANATATAVTAGVAYVLSEAGPVGYIADGWVCTGGGSQTGSTITLTWGENVTCTITNDDIDVDLAVTKTESVDPVVAGSGPGNLVHVVTVTNVGLLDVTVVTLSETLTLPSGVSIDSIAPSGSTTFNDLTDTWTVGNLASGDSETLTVVLTVDGTAAAGTDVISGTATVISLNETDTNSANDTFTEATSVVINILPTASITSPGDGLTFLTTDSIGFGGSGSDNEDGSLTGASLVWTSSLDGQIGTGESFNSALTAGSHTITLTATDSQGASGTASVVVSVNTPPTVSITSPAGGSTFLTTESIGFAGSGSDNEDGALSGASLVWTSSLDAQIGTGASFNIVLTAGSHTITLTAIDSQGASGHCIGRCQRQHAPDGVDHKPSQWVDLLDQR